MNFLILVLVDVIRVRYRLFGWIFFGLLKLYRCKLLSLEVVCYVVIWIFIRVVENGFFREIGGGLGGLDLVLRIVLELEEYFEV